MAIKFNETVKHDRVTIIPGSVVDFADPDAAPYFLSFANCEKTSEAATYTYSQNEISVDPETTFADGPKKGQKILGG